MALFVGFSFHICLSKTGRELLIGPQVGKEPQKVVVAVQYTFLSMRLDVAIRRDRVDERR